MNIKQLSIETQFNEIIGILTTESRFLYAFLLSLFWYAWKPLRLRWQMGNVKITTTIMMPVPVYIFQLVGFSLSL